MADPKKKYVEKPSPEAHNTIAPPPSTIDLTTNASGNHATQKIFTQPCLDALIGVDGKNPKAKVTAQTHLTSAHYLTS